MATDSPSDAATTLFAKLRSLLQGYDIEDFAVYALDDEEAQLIFSSGAATNLEAAPSEKLDMRRLPSLGQFLRSGEAFLIQPPQGTAGPLPGLFVELPGATAIFSLSTREEPVGFILAYGAVPGRVAEPELLEELTRLIDFFSGQLARHRADESMRREHRRVQSKLRELQDGLGVLQLTDRVALYTAVMQRALAALHCDAGMLWLRRSGNWRCEQVVGQLPSGASADAERLLERCYENGKPGLISSLSDEETWEFDIETIHIASVAVFPLRSGAKVIGGIVVFDATVSFDVVDIIEGTSLVGGTAIETWQNAERMLEQQRLEEQLALAARAQQRLLPARSIEIPGLSLAHFSRYCDETGGDYLDAIRASEPFVSAFVLGDVSGHGIGAAMVMVDVRARLRTHFEARAIWSPEEILRQLNLALCREVEANEFVTLFCCVIDTRTGVLRWASAGHEPPLLFKAWENRWQELGSTGLPLGIEPSATYGVESVRVEAEDLLVFATDGATEARNTDGIVFGAEGIRRAVELRPEADAAGVLEVVVKRTLEHHGDRPFADDVTYLVVKVEQIILRVATAAPEMAHEPVWVERFACSREAKDQRLRAVERVLEELYAEYDLHEFLFALDEAMTNAILHGNREEAVQEIDVRLWCDGAVVTIIIEHQGEAFDPRRSIPEHIDERALRQESGRGLLIMTSMMDEVVYWNEGRGVCLVKRLALAEG